MNSNSYQASSAEVNIFLKDLRSILSSDTYQLDILPKKKDEDPLDPYTTENTLLDLGFDKDDVKDELVSLSSGNYLENIIDDKGNDKPPFWVFGKEIQKREVYIKVKIRPNKNIFCVSFHYARYHLKTNPYK